MLRSQDILVVLKIAVWDQDGNWTFDSIAHQLGLSTSAVHRSVGRAERAGLYDRSRRKVDRAALIELLRHGLRFFFPAEWAGEARGIPTAWAAAPLAAEISQSGKNPPVWSDPNGRVRGIALEPIDPRVPNAAFGDPRLAELLALVDAIRIGNARERDLATKHLKALLKEASSR